MKRTLVAVAVAAFAATSANAVTVYNNSDTGTKLDISGSVRVMLNKQTDKRTDLQNDGSRIKFKFSQNLGEGLSALGYMELRPTKSNVIYLEDGEIREKADSKNFGDGIQTNKLYAGLKAENIGELTFGKQSTAADDFKLADPAEHGWTAVDAVGVPTDGKKVINFTSANWEGFGFRTSYSLNENASKDVPNYPTWQGLFTYENKFNEDLGVKAHALYSHTKGEDDAYKVWGLSAGVDYLGLGFAADYTQSKIGDNKVKAWELASTYQVMEPLDVYLSYTHAKYNDDFTTKAVSLGSHYNLTKNVKTYVEYSSKKIGDQDRQNGYYVGLRVFF